jgi:hypothetical protein
MYTILPQIQPIVGIPKTFILTCEEPLEEVIDFQRVRVEEFEGFTGSVINIQKYPKKLKIYRGGRKLKKSEYNLKGKKVTFAYPILNENIIIQYEQDTDSNY